MKIAVFGLGHVGSVAAGCLANQGHSVIGFDVDRAKVAAINSGASPVVEPGIDKLISQAVKDGALRAAARPDGELEGCDIVFVCVGTPSGQDGGHDLGQVINASHSIARAVAASKGSRLTVAYRSTFRPGTCEEVILPIFREHLGDAANDRVEIVHHPEFLREAQAVSDFLNPPRIVIGTLSSGPSLRLQQLYSEASAPVFHVGIREAEMIKFMDNAWHAAKVAFANEMGRICEHLDVSAQHLHEIFIADGKLNLGPAYLRPGAPFGGSCLPKDVRALRKISAEAGISTQLVDAVLESNDAHRDRQFEQAQSGLEPGARLLVVGLAFKQGTDDLRESPQVDLARRLIAAGFRVDIYDPYVVPERMVGQNLRFAEEQIPDLAERMVDKAAAEARPYARVLAGNKLIDQLDISPGKVIALCTIP